MTTPLERRLRTPKAIIIWGLRGWSALQVAGVYMAYLAWSQWRQYRRSTTAVDEELFNGTAAIYHLVQAVAEAAMLAAAVAGLVWLYRAWSHAQSRLPEPAISPGKMVGWIMVPFWGFWRLQRFLLDLAKANNQYPGDVGVGPWWWFCLAFFAFGAATKRNSVPGSMHIIYGALGSVVGWLSLGLFRRLHQGVVAPEA